MRVNGRISPFKIVLLAVCGLALCGCPECPVNQEEHESVVQKLQEAERELDEIKNGPERLAREARAALEAERFEDAVEISARLIERHPGTDEAREIAGLKEQAATRIAAREAEQRRREEAEARERERQAAEEKKREEQRIAEATRAMRKEEDKVRGLTFYHDRNSPRYLNSRSDLHLYFAAQDGRPLALRLRVQYVADDWLFIEKYIVKVDGETYTIEAPFGTVERDNGSGEIWEWYDKVITKDQLEMIRAVIKSRSTVLRYEGQQYYKDRTISASEKKRLENVMVAFDALGGTL